VSRPSAPRVHALMVFASLARDKGQPALNSFAHSVSSLEIAAVGSGPCATASIAA
jgi:hypothetical protein